MSSDVSSVKSQVGSAQVVGKARRVSERDYVRLLAVRTRLRRFERWSAERAARHGLTASQHQLLLAIRGHDEPQGPSVGQIADYLLIRHNSAVELIDRSERAGLIRRVRDADDHRAIRLQLTAAAVKTLEALSADHLQELRDLGVLLHSLLDEMASS